ncbi:MAG TPA: hypothetical protein VMT69_13815 [Kineosporiaceae bacterium]|nr:hypothetical protein [Kineosporiaceae bacterium]
MRSVVDGVPVVTLGVAAVVPGTAVDVPDPAGDGEWLTVTVPGDAAAGPAGSEGAVARAEPGDDGAGSGATGAAAAVLASGEVDGVAGASGSWTCDGQGRGEVSGEVSAGVPFTEASAARGTRGLSIAAPLLRAAKPSRPVQMNPATS